MKFRNHEKKKRGRRARGADRVERFEAPMPVRIEVCVLCGARWEPAPRIRCSCGGSFTWGIEKGGHPKSWAAQKDGRWLPEPVLNAPNELSVK